MRAILLAKATRTSIGGLQASMRAIQEPAGAPWRAAQRRTALAPMISRRRRVRSPIFEVAPSFCLPPVECWSGVSPTQAAKSRPRLKVCAGGARAGRRGQEPVHSGLPLGGSAQLRRTDHLLGKRQGHKPRGGSCPRDDDPSPPPALGRGFWRLLRGYTRRVKTAE